MVELRKRKRFDHSNKRRANFISCEMSLQLDFSDEMIPLPLQLSYPNFLALNSNSQRLALLTNIIKTTFDLEILELSLKSLKQIIGKNKKFPFETVFDENLITVFMNILCSTCENLIILALWVLINVFTDSNDSIQKFVKQGVLQRLCFLIKNSKNREILENSI